MRFVHDVKSTIADTITVETLLSIQGFSIHIKPVYNISLQEGI